MYIYIYIYIKKNQTAAHPTTVPTHLPTTTTTAQLLRTIVWYLFRHSQPSVVTVLLIDSFGYFLMRLAQELFNL